MELEVQAAVSALGCLDGNKYEKEPDCLETLKDLIRYLRRDTDTSSYKVRRQLTSLNVIEKDLIPLLRTFPDETQLFESALRLLINLTQPVGEKMAKQEAENTQENQSTVSSERLKLINDLKRTKRAFVNLDFFLALTEKLRSLLGLDWEQRQEEERLLVERLLILIRNILHIPPTDEDLSEKTRGDLTSHDQIIWIIHKSNLESLLLDLACDESQREFHVYVLEVISLFLRQHAPEILAVSGTERTNNMHRLEQQELAKFQAMEASKKTEQLRRCSRRPTGFAGTYLVHGMKGLNENNDLVLSKPVARGEDFSFDSRKHRKRTPRNRAPAKETLADLSGIASSPACGRRSALEIRLLLKEFCRRFCEAGYNKFMHSIQYALERRDSAADGGSRYHFWWLVRYFTTFVRHGGCDADGRLRWKCVTETLSLHCLHEAQTQLEECMDTMKVEKKEARQWGRKAHMILKAYGELLMMLQAMENSSDDDAIDLAMDLKKTIFYVMEYRELLISLFKKYSPIVFTKLFLKDLVEITHVYLKMLETHCLVYGDELKVQKKRKRRRRRNRIENEAIPENGEEAVVSEALLEEQKLACKEERWQDLADEVSSLLSKIQSNPDLLPKDVVAFDSLADHGIDEKVVAQVRTQEALKKNDVPRAVALLYLSRDIWPDEILKFGQVASGPEDDFLLLRGLYLSEMPVVPGENDAPASTDGAQDRVQAQGLDPHHPHADADGFVNGADEDSDDDGGGYVTSDVQFSFDQYVQRFAHNDVLHWYVVLLDDFASNSVQLNHCVTKMMHRIAYGLKLAPFLYQARLFRAFHKMFNSPAFSSSHGATELATFARHFLVGFFTRAKKEPTVFIEMLFRKGFKEAYEIDYGYGSYQEKKSQSKRKKKQNVDRSPPDDDSERRSTEPRSPGESNRISEEPLSPEESNRMVEESHSTAVVPKRKKKKSVDRSDKEPDFGRDEPQSPEVVVKPKRKKKKQIDRSPSEDPNVGSVEPGSPSSGRESNSGTMEPHSPVTTSKTRKAMVISSDEDD